MKYLILCLGYESFFRNSKPSGLLNILLYARDNQDWNWNSVEEKLVVVYFEIWY